MPTRHDIGLAALEMDGKLDAVEAFAYRLIFDNPPDQEAVPLTRRGAKQLSFANGFVPITDLGAWNVVSLSRLSTLASEWHGLRCCATDERPTVLRSALDPEREAIQRLVNQALLQAAKNLAYASQGRLSADWGSGNRVELADLEPSERVKMRCTYLEALKTVTLIPEILPDGTAWVSFNVRHRLLALPHITMDWVLRKKPQWLHGIRRVRHRYESPGKGCLSAEWIGVASGETPMSTFQTPQGEFSYFGYHSRNGNIPQGEEDIARMTQVVRVRYSKNKEPVLHLASLLQPMFDFETLQDIDSPLLARIAGQLKWPVVDRLKTAHGMIRGIRIPHWHARLRSVAQSMARIESHTLSLKPKVRLLFANGKYGDNEQEVIKLGAYRGMTRKRIVRMVVGNASEAESAERHFLAIKAICERWSGGTSPASTKPTTVWTPMTRVQDAAALDRRLCNAEKDGKSFSDTMFLVGLGKEADKRTLRDVAFRHGIASQCMRLDHKPNLYKDAYYNNLTAGLFSKAGGILCALEDMPGDTELFVGLDLGGTGQRVPGMAFLFTRKGVQLGWQLAEAQRGERVSDDVLKVLLERSLDAFKQAHEGRNPLRIALHRDGRFFESPNVLRDFEQRHGVGVDVLEVIKSGSPPLFRRWVDPKGKADYRNPEVGDAFLLTGLDELIVSTYSGEELGRTWGKSVTVRPLRLRKRHGETALLTLAQQVILLSRIHGASLYRHPRLPVTTHHADRFAALRQECNLDDLSKMDRWCPVYL